MSKIGKRIKIKIEALGLTQEELAKKLGYKSKTTIAKIESGANDIVQSKVKEFAVALNTTIAYLMDWEEDDPSPSDTVPDILYENIKKRREELGLTRVELATRIGYERSMITKIEQGKVDLPQSKILAFATALETTPAHLLGHDVDMKREDSSLVYPSNIIPLPKTRKVPLLGSIACGEPILAVKNIEDYIDMDSDICADFALKSKGDSMINARIFDGDIVYIRKQKNVENGEIAAVLINGTESEAEATLKRVHRENNKLRLYVENPVYSDQVFYDDDINRVNIIGKAVAFLSAVR